MPPRKTVTRKKVPKRRPKRRPTGERKSTWEDLAKDPDLIGTITKHLTTVGLVNERVNGLLMYIAYTSRKLPDPLSVIVRGETASGKNQIQNIPSLLIPSHDVIHVTSMSKTAAYYDEPDAYKHKILKFGERSHESKEESANTYLAIRQLISEKKITHKVTKNQEIITQTQEGPVVFTQTTTLDDVFAEDLNRCLQIYTDESREQTEAIMARQRNPYRAEGENAKERAHIIKLHHAFQDELQIATDKVEIPYIDNVVIPSHHLVARRLFTQVLGTIEAVVFLHQFQRRKNRCGRLVATATDYAIARELLLGPLDKALGGRELEISYEKLKAQFPESFKASAVTTWQKLGSRATVHKILDKLEANGLLYKKTKARGNRAAIYAWTEKEMENVLLPTTKVVCGTSAN